jgi:putative glutamine amidotransferase
MADAERVADTSPGPIKHGTEGYGVDQQAEAEGSSGPDRPLIVVTTSEMRLREATTPPAHGEPPHEEMALGLTYMRAIERAGGIPVVAPPLETDSINPLLGSAAGICLSGGPDLDPAAYGARRHALAGPSWRALDRFELALARAADARGLPILAICRGLQVLNVARGGTLHQHLPDVVGDRIVHRQHEPGTQPTHAVNFSSSGRLTTVINARSAMVNSFHHQAVADLGDRLVATAWADDGTVEAIEAVDREFVIAVQWHAETLIQCAGNAALFSAFIAAARRVRRESWPPALAA